MRTAAVLLAYSAALGLGLYQTFRPTFESGFARTQTERCDGMLNHYILEHSWQAVSNPDYRGSLFSPPCFFPETWTLFYSEHLLGVAPVYWVLRLGLPPDLAYPWWQIVMAALNFVTAAVAVRWLGVPHTLALLGGYLWGFALVHVEQVKHQQMIPRLWMPLAAYHAWAFAAAVGARAADPFANPARHLNRMMAFVFLQALACVYTGWFLVAGLAVFLPLAFGLRPDGWADLKRWLREDRRAAGRVVGGWVVALVAVFVPYVAVNWGIVRSYKECEGLIPTPWAWFTGPPGSRWDELLAPPRALQSHPRWVSDECYLFCGFGLYALFLAAAVHLLVVRRQDRPPAATLAAAGLLTALVWVVLTLALRNGGPSPWQVVRMIPGGGAIRCVSRVYVTVYLFAGLAALVWLGLATANLRPGLRAAAHAAVAAVIIFEQTGYRPPSFDRRDFYPIADRAAEALRGAEAAYVVPRYTDTTGKVLDYGDGEVLAMWVGLRANVPVVNGYSGRFPRGEHPAGFPADDEKLRRWLTGKFRGTLTVIDPDRPDSVRVLVFE